MVNKKIVIILGHPNASSYCASLAQTYEQTALAQGHEVKVFSLGELSFDPILKSSPRNQPLEPALLEIQQAILWSSHLVFAYPIWWGSMPALLKGFFDRTFTPGFAYQYRKNSSWWDKLLKGRSADLIVTLDTPAWYFRWIYKMPGLHQMKLTILEWCGIKPVKILAFSPIRYSTPEQREKWRQQIIARVKSLS
jgi:NAD(P)H dehydrogenase (quinone)